MIVDSTALPEQAVRDIVASAFQSAGQRCSALRMLYLQEDIAEPFLKMLFGAMDELVVGNPWDYATDIGPVIDEAARAMIQSHIDAAQADNRLLKTITRPNQGTFVPPAVIQLNGIKDLKQEIFGPVLHVATYASDELDRVLADINGTGFGLTFGLHSRIDDRVEYITSRKTTALSSISLPGPTGESNQLSIYPRGTILCLGPTKEDAIDQAQTAIAQGCAAIMIAAGLNPEDGFDGTLQADALEVLSGFDGVVSYGDEARLRAYRVALSNRTGRIIPLIHKSDLQEMCQTERHICIDTTAAGGNASLLAEVS